MCALVAKAQLLVTGELEQVTGSTTLTYTGRGRLFLSYQFVRRQVNNPSFVQIPFVAIGGLSPGTYAVTVTSNIAVSNVTADSFDPARLFYGIYTVGFHNPLLTLHNPLLQPFLVTQPQETLLLDITAVLAGHFDSRPPHFSPVQGTARAQEPPGQGVAAAVGESPPAFTTNVVLLSQQMSSCNAASTKAGGN